MYNLINILPDILPEAEKFVFDNDRELYIPFLRTIERFVIDNGLIIGGKIGLDLLVGKPLTKDSFEWDVYADDTYATAKRLATALHETKAQFIDTRFIGMRTDLRHKEFTIFINTRPMVKVYSLDRYHGIKLAELMGPVPRTSYILKENIFCVPEEMQLIEIYRGLYSPSRVKDWPDLIKAEHALFNLIEGHIGEKALKVVGSAQPVPRAKVDQILLRYVARQCKQGTATVLVGDYALTYYDYPAPQSPRVQFITDVPIDDLVVALEREIKRKVSTLANYRVTYVRYALNIPTDFQIIKHTLYLSTGKEQTPIADTFNCTEFELIPYTLAKFDEALNIRIGNPWVLLRFRFIDIWVLKLISSLDKNSAKFLRAKVLALLDSISALRRHVIETLKTAPDLLFQLNDYAGVYINEIEAKKRLIKETGEKFAIFYPAKKDEANQS